MRGGKHYPPSMNANDSLSQLPSSGRQSWAKYTQIGSGKIFLKNHFFLFLSFYYRSRRNFNKVSDSRMIFGNEIKFKFNQIKKLMAIFHFLACLLLQVLYRGISTKLIFFVTIE
jgi:hypothetical protein